MENQRLLEVSAPSSFHRKGTSRLVPHKQLRPRVPCPRLFALQLPRSPRQRESTEFPGRTSRAPTASVGTLLVLSRPFRERVHPGHRPPAQCAPPELQTHCDQLFDASTLPSMPPKNGWPVRS